jgi:CHAT domain-containing protein
VTKRSAGDFAGACLLQEEVLAVETLLLSDDHPRVLRARKNLAKTKAALGLAGDAREQVALLLAGMSARVRGARADSPRAAREIARQEIHRLFDALELQAAIDAEGVLVVELFEALESLRMTSVAGSEVARVLAERPELGASSVEIAELRRELSECAASVPGTASEVESWRARIVGLARERDRLERELRALLGRAGVFDGSITADAIGKALGDRAAAVSYLRHHHHEDDDQPQGRSPDALVALLVGSSGTVTRIDLGPAADLDALVGEWRASLGQPVGRGVGAQAVAEIRAVEVEVGRRLRERILDPVLAAAGNETRVLHVVLDDLLYLVPLDALPIDEDARVGDRLRIHQEISFLRLVAPQSTPEEGRLVAVGGVDFDGFEESEGSDLGAVAKPVAGAAAPPLDERGTSFRLRPLPETKAEIRKIGARYEERFGVEPVLLEGKGATKDTLLAQAKTARFLHLATHGWFAPETFRSQLDELTDASERAEETLHGFAPETLCGLALSGANLGRDPTGRVAGILTAEELAACDLRSCELAVLSACETNVGLRRAGQGIQSLQTALHAAGVRTAITSLWKVDDAATRRLFELFYAQLWNERASKAEALWQAKLAMRAEGHALRDWAGWMLTGDTE